MQNGTKAKVRRKTDGFEPPSSWFPLPKNKSKNRLRQLIEAISLLLLQLVSLATTLDGARLFFRDEQMPFIEQLPIVYVLGFGIQL